MKIAMMQPDFLPWQGLFEQIYKSDNFIFLDNFQFSVQSHQQRNRLFVNKNQVGWYSVPVQKSISFMAPINEVKINELIPWRKKMAKRIQSNYSKANYYNEIYPVIQEWLLTPAFILGHQNIEFIKLVCNMLDLKTKFYYSSDCPSSARRSGRVIDLLRYFGATYYLCARGAFSYMKEDGLFPVEDIEVLFQNFIPKEYEQIGSSKVFIPYLSILDALFNVGPKQTLELIKNGTAEWITYEKMIEISKSGV